MKCWEQLYYSLFVPSWRCPATPPSSSCHWCCRQWQSGTLQTTPPWPSSATHSSRQRAVIAITGMAYSTASNVCGWRESSRGATLTSVNCSVTCHTVRFTVTVTSQPCAAASCSVQSGCSSPDSLSPSLPGASLNFLKTSPVVKVDRWDWLSTMMSM